MKKWLNNSQVTKEIRRRWHCRTDEQNDNICISFQPAHLLAHTAHRRILSGYNPQQLIWKNRSAGQGDCYNASTHLGHAWHLIEELWRTRGARRSARAMRQQQQQQTHLIPAGCQQHVRCLRELDGADAILWRVVEDILRIFAVLRHVGSRSTLPVRACLRCADFQC